MHKDWNHKYMGLSRFFKLFTACFTVFSHAGFAQLQKDTIVEQKINDLSAIWTKYIGLSDHEQQFSDLAKAQDFFNRQKITDDTSYYALLRAYRDAAIVAAKDDYGLKLSATYYDNFGSPVIADDDLIYRMRAQVGLDWDILRDGLYGSKLHTEKLQNEYLLSQYQHKKQKTQNLFVDKYAFIIYLYNSLKIKVLDQRKEINTAKLTLTKELSRLKELPYVDVIDVDQSLTDINGMYMVYKSYNDLEAPRINSKDLPSDPFPLVDIDFAKLSAQVLQLQGNRQDDDSIVALKIKNMGIETNPLNSISLRAQLKYNYYYIDPQVGSRDYISLGLGFSMPLPIGKKNDLKVVEAQKKLLMYESQSQVNTDTYEELLNNLYEYRYKLKQYLNFYQKKIKLKELLRVERVKESFDDTEFNPVSALGLLDDLLATEVEMLDIQQQMYLQMLKIENAYPGIKMAECIQPFSLGDYEKKEPEDMLNRSVYIWSSAFDEYNNNFIAEYLVLNHFKNALVSVPKDGKYNQRISALADTLTKHGISIQLMFGNNKLLKEDFVKYADAVLGGIDMKNISGIHLDVEPHTNKDWKGNENKYMDQYITMLKSASEYCKKKGLKLSVSIPLYYPDGEVEKIYLLCDRVYLMAYENTDMDFVQKKSSNEIADSKDKTVLAVRTEDFADAAAMEDYIQKISQKLGVKNIAVHDFSRLVDKDEEGLDNHKKED